MTYPGDQTHIQVLDLNGALRQLEETFQSPGYVYALADGALDEDGTRRQSLFGDMPKTPVYAGTELHSVADVGPVLVTLPRERDFFPRFLPAMAEELPCLLLTSPRTAEELRQIFQHRVEVKLENSNIFLFRFQDAAITKPFLKSLTRQRAAHFFGPVETLIWPETDMRGNPRWLSCSFPSQSETVFRLFLAALQKQPHPCWEATEEEWRTFQAHYAEDVSLTDLCRYLLDREVEQLQGLSDEEILKKVADTVALAKTYSLSSEYDIYTFCKLELDLFPGIHLHPAVHALLSAPAKDPRHKMLALSSLDMRTWAELQVFAEEYQVPMTIQPER